MITAVNNTTYRIIAKEAEAALKAVGDKLGVTFKFNGGRLTSTSFNLQMKVALKDVGNGLSSEEVDFRRYCGMFGLKPEHYRKTVAFQNTVYRLIGFSPSSYKYPILAERVHDKKVFKLQSSTVTRQLGKVA